MASQFGAPPLRVLLGRPTLPSVCTTSSTSTTERRLRPRPHGAVGEPHEPRSENAATFLLTNILPQAAENNQGPWSGSKTSSMTRCAPAARRSTSWPAASRREPGTLKNEGKVAIPDYTWKVAVIVQAGQGLADVERRVGPAGDRDQDRRTGSRPRRRRDPQRPWQTYDAPSTRSSRHGLRSARRAAGQRRARSWRRTTAPRSPR